VGRRMLGVATVRAETDQTLFPHTITHAQAARFMRVRGTVAVNLARPTYLQMAGVARVGLVMRAQGTVGFGKGVTQDHKEAVKWYRKNAD
jgi:hypothetical protein